MCIIVYIALYVFAPQGRVSGIASIKYEQFEEMRLQGHATTSEFKTHKKYGLQSVIVIKKILDLMTAYVELLRPRALLNAVEKGMTRSFQKGHHNFLWLTWSGERDQRIGRHVTEFFKANLGLHVTTTNIRSLVETTAHNAMLEGTITSKERNAIQMINGHSSKTTEDYYHKHDRCAESKDARSGFSRLGVETDTDLEPDPIEWPQQDDCVTPQFGAKHPDIGNDTSRAKWTEAEKSYIGKFCSRTKKEHPHCYNVVAKCLQHILEDEDCHEIFHPRHVTDSSRLRFGWIKYQDERAVQSPCIRSAGFDPDWNSRMTP
jgi:hypothetical protein